MCQLKNFKYIDKKPECMIEIRKIYTEVVQQIKNNKFNKFCSPVLCWMFIWF